MLELCDVYFWHVTAQPQNSSNSTKVILPYPLGTFQINALHKMRLCGLESATPTEEEHIWIEGRDSLVLESG